MPSRNRTRDGRPVDGLLLLNKPVGVTSNGALQKVKRLLGVRKAGHTGSLDPAATGMSGDESTERLGAFKADDSTDTAAFSRNAAAAQTIFNQVGWD